MAEFKNHKLLANVTEFDKVGNKYLINGIDLNKAVYFWREPQKMYDVIPKGSYTITTEGNSTYLNITDDVALGKIERIQICYQFASVSSTYEVDFLVDVNILKDRYNEAVGDIKNIFEYIKKNMMVADGQDLTVVLPNLKDGEVWVKDADGWRGFAIGDLEANIGEQLKRFQQMVDTAFKGLEDKRDEYVVELESVKDGQLQTLTNYLELNLGRVREEGNRQVTVVKSTGTEEGLKLNNYGNLQHDRLNTLITHTAIDTKLILMNQMFDIIIGSNRYLNGQNLDMRASLFLDRNPNGQLLSTRTDLRSSYDGGLLSNRVITIPDVPSGLQHPLNIDLGEFKGGNQ